MGVKRTAAKGKKVTLKMVKKVLKVTAEGRRSVDLSNLGIATFPKCLLKMADVDELDLSRNLLQTLPEDVGSLTSLSRLDLHSNKLEALPEALGQLVGLTHLNVSNNRLSSGGLPAALGALTRLQSLNLGLNRLDRLPPGLAALPALQDVGLFDNLFTELPQFLTAVGTLNAKRNPCSYGRGDGAGDGAAEPRATGLYLAPESSLCRACLYRCRQERPPHRRSTRGDGRGPEEDKRKRTYSGLVSPNSVAAANQDAWRMRG
ncbi:leucine-rich repeat-containing protein 18 [Gadus morhua]|uniref:leucine-rich repeat-containing protein 18 n=1 Tax=Gadus morhua TaxID=8049 RepID=UPI003F49D2F3